MYTEDTPIKEVINDPVFGDYGRLIFPVEDLYWSGDTLGDLRLTFYSNIDPEKTLEICSYFKEHAESGETIFYDIYTDDEKSVKRCSHQNPSIQTLYKEFLGEPLSEKSHHLLHTEYQEQPLYKG